ncbi:hypothetical protein AB434_1227 [Heyndrickxia coagulans]|uniref:Uncharacterized protein n=1 Tax=Heyndrickxia coagulans TaxID=1398 RepID=A0AAN0T8M7_HEYCO|nr:hypothetical protein SB48_HM08orf06539 [Heyndrickxia coagulans]AKN53632.1 hypothetical protein AB434_1227 [Heyndrickxia coagulans]KYC64522.1 hypothetical protein B4100_1315 [Heyndrickxia coagulans]
MSAIAIVIFMPRFFKTCPLFMCGFFCGIIQQTIFAAFLNVAAC